MTLRCPHCSSKNIARSQTATAVTTSLGALGGIASAVLAATRQASKSTPLTFTPITIANLLISDTLALNSAVNLIKLTYATAAIESSRL